MGSVVGSTTCDPAPVNMPGLSTVEPADPRHRNAPWNFTVWRFLATVLCLGVHGCTQPTGGAVELSWALRSTLDRDISDCAGGRIGRIRLWWDDGRNTRWVAFPCEDNHGVTAFDLPTGSVGLSISPECLSGLNANPVTYTAPPPIVRTVATGEAVTLDALLLVVQVDDCANRPCICAP